MHNETDNISNLSSFSKVSANPPNVFCTLVAICRTNVYFSLILLLLESSFWVSLLKELFLLVNLLAIPLKKRMHYKTNTRLHFLVLSQHKDTRTTPMIANF